jgi:hypothetical protein
MRTTICLERTPTVTHASHTVAQAGQPSRTATALGRIGNVIVDPTAAFRSVATTPTSALAFFTLVILRFTSVLTFYRPEIDAPHLAAGVLFQLVTIWPLSAALTLLAWTASRAWGARASWASTYCVVVHVMVAYTLATVAIASVVGALLPENTTVDLRHPPFTNLGPLVDASTSPIAHALLVETDYRATYALILTFFGVRESSSDRNTSRAWLIVGTCFAANLLMTAITAYARQP